MECSRRSVKHSTGTMKSILFSSLWKKETHSRLSLSLSLILRRRWPRTSWKMCFKFIFLIKKSVDYVCTVVFQLSDNWRQAVTMLYHCANCVQVGIKSHSLPFNRLRIGVIHGIFKSSLPIVIFMYRASCVLCFWCSSGKEGKEEKKIVSFFF